MGIERKSLVRSEQDNLETAIHEAGHTLIAYYTNGAKQIYKATIVPHGSTLGSVNGYKYIIRLLLYLKKVRFLHLQKKKC